MRRPGYLAGWQAMSPKNLGGLGSSSGMLRLAQMEEFAKLRWADARRGGETRPEGAPGTPASNCAGDGCADSAFNLAVAKGRVMREDEERASGKPPPAPTTGFSKGAR